MTLDVLRRALPAGFSVDRPLGAGGQGAVFVGRYAGAEVALKVFRPDDPRRVARELQLLSSIDCPHLVKLRTSTTVTINRTPMALLAYEYHPGGTLHDLLDPAAAQVAAADLKRIGEQVGMALEAMWERRIVHRDVKPPNVVRAADGRYVLVDVGVARHLDLSDITGVGGAPGTPGYKSPEQARGNRNLTIHSDAFSLGLTVYELAAKEHPFHRDQRTIPHITPTDLARLRPDLPAPLVRLVHDLIAPSAYRRPLEPSARFRALSI